jgi:hypothetical protein
MWHMKAGSAMQVAFTNSLNLLAFHLAGPPAALDQQA